MSDVRFFACTVNLLLRSLTHSSLLSTLPQTPFMITLQILVENSLSFVSCTAPEHAKGELWAIGKLSFTACSSGSDSTDNVEALLLKSLPSCEYNNRQHYTLHQHILFKPKFKCLPEPGDSHIKRTGLVNENFEKNSLELRYQDPICGCGL